MPRDGDEKKGKYPVLNTTTPFNDSTKGIAFLWVILISVTAVSDNTVFQDFYGGNIK